MKKILFVFAVAVLTIVGCSSTPTSRSFKEQWNDSMVTSRVKWKMGQDKIVHARNIDVVSWRGTVTMIGHVAADEEKMRAEQVAIGVQGVTGVKNYIEVVGGAAVEASKVAKEINEETIKTETIKPESVKPEPAKQEPVEKAAVAKANKGKLTKAAKKSAKKAAPAKVEETAAKTVVENDLIEDPIKTKHQNGVSYQIGKDLASTKRDVYVDSEMPPNDITRQAEQELKELKSKKGK